MEEQAKDTDAEVVLLRPDQSELRLELDLPDGHHAKLRDPRTVSERERRPLKAERVKFSRAWNGPPKPVGSEVALSGNPLIADFSFTPPETEEDVEGKLEALAVLSSVVIAFFVVSWDYPEPVTPDAVDQLPARVYDELDVATTSLYNILFPDNKGGPTTP